MKTTLWIATAALLLAGGVFAYNLASARAHRSDCPGKIICPITGEEICRDRCPLGAAPTASETTPACCRSGK